MRSVLAFAGFFLFLGYRVVMLPVLSVLYMLLAVVVFCNYYSAAYRQLAVLLAPLKNTLLRARQVPKFFQKGSFSSLWQKTWAFSNGAQ